MRLVVLSDIHANLSALNAVIDHFTKKYTVDAIALLGDIVDYGPRPNEVIAKLESLNLPVVCNLHGNHEKALFADDLVRFSSDRGRQSLLHTRSVLSDHSLQYIGGMESRALVMTTIDRKKLLFVHGDLSDPYWGKMPLEETADDKYAGFDYVFSGHTHIPRLQEMYYTCDDAAMRNLKKTVFLNPGSVGQPRNHNRNAQYLYVDLESEIVHFNSVGYDIAGEIALFSGEVDQFYAERLLYGI